jgi:hypothetical protein
LRYAPGVRAKAITISESVEFQRLFVQLWMLFVYKPMHWNPAKIAADEIREVQYW